MRTISLASGTLPEFDPVTVVAAAAHAGFDGCGIWFDAATWTDETTRATAAAFRDTGLTPLEIEVLVVGDPAADAPHARLLDAGAAIGATEAIVVSREPDVSRTAARLARLDELAKPRGIRLNLEFLPIFEIRNLAEARNVVDRVGSDNVKILVDPLHVARSGTELAEIAALPRALVSFAQFCDAPPTPPGDGGFDALYDEAINGRLLPGDGDLPLARLLAALPADLPLSLEMRAAWLRQRHPDPKDRARVVMDGMRRWLKAAGID
jgi:sugar phosphate isomerase/epimerase